MSTLFLSNAFSTIGHNILGPVGKFVGSQIAYHIGNKIDREILYGNTQLESNIELKDLNLQTAVYGKMIPIIFGTVKISGTIIWADKTKLLGQEFSTKQVERFDLSNSQTSINYVQYKNFAISICEGEISELVNIFVNDQLLDKNNFKYRLYKGTETQEVDYLIKNIEKEAPAYRGIAYIVIEDFPLTMYGNRIPSFSFEVRRKLNTEISKKIKNINIIPGSGEFVYDTKIQFKINGEYIKNKWIKNGYAKRINQNTHTEVADCIVSMNDLEENFPNIEWVSVVITWFVDKLDIAKCKIYPAVEYKLNSISIPDDWRVANINRNNAQHVTLDENNNPIYGGTVSDSSLLNFLNKLKGKYKIMLYPILFVDEIKKPWRGNLTGNAKDIKIFFIKYKKFILHYAKLTKNLIDGIIIGSEMKGITSIKILNNVSNQQNSLSNTSYPGVEEFITLANEVKQIVNQNTIITYAADWSEYHSINGEYNMDKLWASSAISFVGIDAYFPITDQEEPQEGFSIDDIKKGWNSNEGYDYYYLDSNNKTGKTQYNDSKYAWKNIYKWWSEEHINPNGNKTPWIPKMKKIWFTEYGFASVDGCSNQPNVFIDQSSKESKLPHYSKGNVSFNSQITAIYGTLLNWENSEMVEKMFLWCWDARPYPYFPHLKNVWSDWSSWETGHWIQGKIMLSNLKDIINDLAKRVDLNIEFTAHNQLVSGYVLQNNQSIANAIITLQNIYFFDIVEKSGKIYIKSYININEKPIIKITDNDISDKDQFRFSVITDYKIPSRLSIIYISSDDNYKIKTQSAQRDSIIEKHRSIYIPIVIKDSYARFIVKTLLYKMWNERIQYKFSLMNNLIKIEAGDIISYSIPEYFSNTINDKKNSYVVHHLIKIQQIRYGKEINISGNSVLIQNYNLYSPPSDICLIEEGKFISNTEFGLLDLPNLVDDLDENYLRFFVINKEDYWFGCKILYSSDDGKSYNFLTEIYNSSTVGTAISKLNNGPYGIFDEGNELIIILNGNKTLSSVEKLAVLNGKNILLVGNEIIHFAKVEFLGNNKYKISSFIRGCYGTEQYMDTHTELEQCILIDENIKKIPIVKTDIGKELIYKAVSLGSSSESDLIKFVYNAVNLKPFSVIKVKINDDNDGNLYINWIRRSRINNNWLDFVDISLDETTECYEIDIIDTKTKIKKRTLSAINKTETTYTVEEQNKDFDYIKNIDITVYIYQISDKYGRGNKSNEVSFQKIN